MKLEAQPISEEELAAILKLHQCRIGWSNLLESIIADRNVGFPCENEEFLIRRELKSTVYKVSEWFKIMGNKHKWPSREGWIWEIDFKSSQASPKKQWMANSSEQNKNLSECEIFVEGPIMSLGDMDLDIIKRLLEEREALSDLVRSHLRKFKEGDLSTDEIYDTIAQLGAADIDVRNWFSEMANNYKWPKPKTNSWSYRVDVAEKQVYLSRNKS